MQNQGYFGTNSTTWQVASETIIMLGGARAVMMQLAHPLVAMGVSAHSSYMSDPFGRAERTFILGQMLTFGNVQTARQAARTINHLHKHVHGTLPAPAGDYAEGTHYSAQDQQLLLWVQATLIDTILLLYQMFVRPLSPAEQDQYYQESKVMGRLLGLTDAVMPRTVDDLRAYVHAMCYGNQLAATPQGRQLVQRVLYPPISGLFRPLTEFNVQFTNAVLPQPIREIYGLEWGPKRQLAFDLFVASVKALLPHLPPTLRVLPITQKMMQTGQVSTRLLFNPPGFAFHA